MLLNAMMTVWDYNVEQSYLRPGPFKNVLSDFYRDSLLQLCLNHSVFYTVHFILTDFCEA